MTILEAVILGLVQGLSEFLPISSSGHLVLVQKLLGMSDTQELFFFNIMLHVGTLAAVASVFYKDIWSYIRRPFSRVPMMLVLSAVPALIVALLFNDFIEASFGGQFLGACFLLTAVILFVSEALAGRTASRRPLEDMKWYDSVFIGTAQALAIFPGVSRSGSTISAGLVQGFDRRETGKFSMLMSMIAILGSTVLEVPKVIEAGTMGVGAAPLMAGMLAAGVSGYIAVRWMLRILTRGSLKPFALYMLILGLVTLGDQFIWRGLLAV
ncbi:MAG: undecaprenyl-diphosphate phosphatase [Christensenellales bacterium]|jgi:undecaprenyl-diphosphatase